MIYCNKIASKIYQSIAHHIYRILKAHFTCIALIHNLFLEEARTSIRVLSKYGHSNIFPKERIKYHYQRNVFSQHENI